MKWSIQKQYWNTNYHLEILFKENYICILYIEMKILNNLNCYLLYNKKQSTLFIEKIKR